LFKARAAYENLKKIRAAGEMLFRSGDETRLVRIRAVRIYASFEDMPDHENLQAIGGSWASP
jgi:ASC-1-like (ASCH) protein